VPTAGAAGRYRGVGVAGWKRQPRICRQPRHIRMAEDAQRISWVWSGLAAYLAAQRQWPTKEACCCRRLRKVKKNGVATLGGVVTG
jgi:hypothetical protein